MPPIPIKCQNRWLIINTQTWSHYIDYNTWCCTINPGSAYIKRWRPYCTASVHAQLFKELSSSHLLHIHTGTHTRQRLNVGEDELYMDMKGGTEVSPPDSDLHMMEKLWRNYTDIPAKHKASHFGKNQSDWLSNVHWNNRTPLPRASY